MRLRHRAPDALAPVAVEPTSDVRIVVVPPRRSEEDGCYLVKDGLGEIHPTGTHDRREALREMGGFAVRGAAAPLVLLWPDGSPTGDRIA